MGDQFLIYTLSFLHVRDCEAQRTIEHMLNPKIQASVAQTNNNKWRVRGDSNV